MNDTKNLLIIELKKLQINLSTVSLEKLFHYVDLLLEANKTTNLTAITDYQEALFKHLYDSLMILNNPVYLDAKRIIDVGSGAGLPSIPLALCSPEKEFISIDSVQKKIKFQEQACQSLELKNIKRVWGRVEDYINNYNEREQFDLTLARAVAPLNILVELTLPFIKNNGYALLYKGKEFQNELQAAERAIITMGGKVADVQTAELPIDFGARSILTIKKIKSSPKQYPRKAGVPQKKPL